MDPCRQGDQYGHGRLHNQNDKLANPIKIAQLRDNKAMENEQHRQMKLLCVIGLTPQVVTETLYAMHRLEGQMPVQVDILTTAEGADRANLTLLHEKWLQRFYQDYQLEPPEFSVANIHILQNQQGALLQDIRSPEDNQAMADGITEKIRQMTADAEMALHVSIAGGRKTMGFYAGYALSLYGRTQDSLSHVLVAPDYESHPQFYYPTPYSHIIYGNDPTRKPLDTQKAEVMLAEINFVRLRHGLDQSLLEGRSSFSESVSRAQQILGPPKLKIDLQQRLMKAQDTVIKMRPVELAFYSWLLKRQLAREALPFCPSDGAPEMRYASQYLQEYHLINGELGGSDRTFQALERGMSKAFFEQRKSRINSLFKQTLPMSAKFGWI
jgi:CRISPR-associated protein (TIGR02584 family)